MKQVLRRVKLAMNEAFNVILVLKKIKTEPLAKFNQEYAQQCHEYKKSCQKLNSEINAWRKSK